MFQRESIVIRKNVETNKGERGIIQTEKKNVIVKELPGIHYVVI